MADEVMALFKQAPTPPVKALANRFAGAWTVAGDQNGVAVCLHLSVGPLDRQLSASIVALAEASNPTNIAIGPKCGGWRPQAA